jgi:hypothetical protein
MFAKKIKLPLYQMMENNTARVNYYLNVKLLTIKTLHMKRKTLNQLKGISFILLWTISLNLFAQSITVKGTVTDANKEPIIGATIVEQGNTAHGTVTDIDGNYTLTNVPPNATLQFSYVGMKSQSIAGGWTYNNKCEFASRYRIVRRDCCCWISDTNKGSGYRIRINSQ